jgi:hypothetical protein
MIRFIDLYRQRSSTQHRPELTIPGLEAIIAGENDDDDVHTGHDRWFHQAPALGHDAARPVPGYSIAVLAYGNENGAGFRAAIRPDIQAQALAGPAAPFVEHPGYVAPRTDALRLPESETGCAPFVVRHGNQYFFFSSDVLSLMRPLARRLFRMAWPPLVFMRALNPNFLTRRVLLG